MTDPARVVARSTSSRPATKKRTTSRRGSGTIAIPASTTAMSARSSSVVGQQRLPRRQGRGVEPARGDSTTRRPARSEADSSQRCCAQTTANPSGVMAALAREGPGGTLVPSGLECAQPWTDLGARSVSRFVRRGEAPTDRFRSRRHPRRDEVSDPRPDRQRLARPAGGRRRVCRVRWRLHPVPPAADRPARRGSHPARAVASPADDRHEVLPLRPRRRRVAPAVLRRPGPAAS